MRRWQSLEEKFHYLNSNLKIALKIGIGFTAAFLTFFLSGTFGGEINAPGRIMEIPPGALGESAQDYLPVFRTSCIVSALSPVRAATCRASIPAATILPANSSLSCSLPSSRPCSRPSR